MPNWCENQATVHGTKQQILELAGAYERGGVCEHFLPTPLPGTRGVEDKANYRRKNWGMKWDFGKTLYSPDEECDWQVDETGFGLAHLPITFLIWSIESFSKIPFHTPVFSAVISLILNAGSW
jgi:hypothetical protein